eukprot:1404538-Pyramimonas_sp.AAC.1
MTSSLRSFDLWRGPLLGAESAALGSSLQCRGLVSTLAHFEKLVARGILKEGVVFRVSADGLDRACQGEIGTLLWSLPLVLDSLHSYGG